MYPRAPLPTAPNPQHLEPDMASLGAKHQTTSLSCDVVWSERLTVANERTRGIIDRGIGFALVS